MSRNLPGILDQMPDIAYLEQLIVSLHDDHGIRAFLLDKDNQRIMIRSSSHAEFPCKKIYPLDSIAGISGLLCTAEREEVLATAEKSIELCCAGISALLQRETEVLQMSEEILELSEQINFLFNLSKNMIGIKRLQTFCEMSIREISKKIGADYGFISIKDTHNKAITAAYHLSREESFKIQEENIFEIARQRSDTVLSTIEDHISAIVSPITTKDGVIGFIAFFRHSNKRFFTSYEKKFVSIVNNSISYIIETLRLYDNLKQLYLNTVKALAIILPKNWTGVFSG
ncbi:MAG: GAF domain-containing protein [Nitrospirota bacterium]